MEAKGEIKDLIFSPPIRVTEDENGFFIQLPDEQKKVD
jgi:hypothetical protein